MSASSNAPPGGPPLARSLWPREIAGRIAFAAVIALARLRAFGRKRRVASRADRDRVRRSLASGEVIIAFPEQAWRGARSERVSAVVDLVVERMGRWGVSRLTNHLDGLSRRYLCLRMTPGGDDDVVRAVKVAAWRFGLPRGRRGLLVVRSPLILPATPPDPPGPIVFTKEYAAAKAAVGATNASAQDVKVLIVDIDRPDKGFLPASGADRVTVLDDSDVATSNGHAAPISNGHATLMTAIVADVAKGAQLQTLSIGDAHGAGGWSLLNVFLGRHEADVIVASIAAPEGRRSKNERDRETVFESSLRTRVFEPSQPPVLFPTGNHEPDKGTTLDTMAIPARFASVIAIGAVDPELRRAAGSRYGSKQGGDPSAWWLAPGGSFGNGVSDEPLVTMGGAPQAGTSIANAIAGGIAALVIQKLKERTPTHTQDSEFDDAMEALKRRLRATPGNEESVALAEAIGSRHAGEAKYERLVAELDRLSEPKGIEQYNAVEHGRGLLHLR